MTSHLPNFAEPLLVRPRDAWRMLGCGNTHGYQLLNAGELESFLDGRTRKITVESIHRFIARRLAPADANKADRSLSSEPATAADWRLRPESRSDRAPHSVEAQRLASGPHLVTSE
jgi:hypothetical protein